MSNFDQIQTFIEVANSQSFAEASRRLSLSTSAVSARVKALEKRLNVRLLNRNTRVVRLTDEGELYLARCQDALEQLLAIEDTLGQQSQLSGRIRVTIPLELPMAPFAALLCRFTELHHRVTIDIHASNETVDLIANTVDVAIRGRAPGALSLVSRKLGEGQLAFVAAPDYLEQQNAGAASLDPAQHSVLDPLNIGASLASQCPWQKGALDTQSLMLSKQLCLHAKTVALLPLHFCKQEIDNARLVLVDTGLSLPTLPLFVVYPSRKNVPIRVRTFIEFLLQSQAALPLI